MKKLCFLFLMISLLTACAGGGFDSVKKTTELRQGMTYREVVQLLGEPKTSELKSKSLVATFWLHQSWRGNVPYDLVFDPSRKTLISWSENREKFAASQKELSQICGYTA